MYTQCPECQTIFVVTDAQLQARAGLVRCGKCAAVFQASHSLFDTLPVEVAAPEPVVSREAQARAPAHESANAAVEPEEAAAGTGEDSQIPTITEFRPRKPRRVHRGWWALANVLLVLLLAAQLAFFFRDYLARIAWAAPWMEAMCEAVGCEIRPLQDPRQIELVEVEVAPHPTYNKSLRVTAVLVNRAVFSQPFPLLELSLTDNRGVPVARRTFQPEEYLVPDDAEAEEMPPNVAIAVELEITQPDAAAVGYEVQLVSSS